MTEIEAKTKWCPMTRVRWAKLNDAGKYVTEGDGGFNRARISFTSEERMVGLCIASECMMWRNGYCGLAGIPLPPVPEAAAAAADAA